MFLNDICEMVTKKARFENTRTANVYMTIQKSFDILNRWMEFQFGDDTTNFIKLLGKFLDWQTGKFNCMYIAGPADAGKSLVKFCDVLYYIYCLHFKYTFCMML